MNEHRPKEIPPRHPPAKKPTDVHGDAIEAIDKELTKDLTYVGGTRRKSAGPTDKSLNKSHNKSLKKNLAKARMQPALYRIYIARKKRRPFKLLLYINEQIS